jgi:4-amino-4-deoxy-L-arabinose transferase-like glycosyltransferase
MVEDGKRLLLARHPVFLVSLVSLTLVVIAMLSDPVLNRDGMYYVDTARAMLSSNALADHEWLLFPAMLASVADLFSVDPLRVAQLYSLVASVLLAVCLFVWLYRSGHAGAPRVAALTTLTVPWLLEYQAYVIRDSAAWLALVATLMLARFWVRGHQWRWLVLMLPVACVGFLFRTEMLVLLVVPGWLALVAGWRRGAKTMMVTLIAAAVVAALLIPLAWDFVLGHIRFYLDAVRSSPDLMLLPDFVASLEAHVNPYVRSDLSTVLTAGLVALPLIGLTGLLGIYLLPLVLGLQKRATSVLRQDDGASAVMLLVFLAVVLAFLFVMQFVTGRYLVPLAICLMPWVYQGMLRLDRDFPRIFKGFAVLAIVTALSASFSTGGGKGYMRDAGEFVAQHHAQLAPVYYTDARVAFYAGDRYRPKKQVPLPLADRARVDAAQTLVLLVRKDGEDIARSLEQVKQDYGFAEVVFQADNGDDKGVLVLSR